MTDRVVFDVDDAGFDAQVLEASHRTPVVVDFWAGWCQPCLILGPILERVAAEHAGRFRLAKVDVDRNPATQARYRIQGIPAVKAFRDGEQAWEFVGVQPEDAVRRLIDELVPSAADDLVAEARAAGSEGAAESAYRKALAEEPGHAEATAGLVELLLARDEVEEARDLLAKAPPDGAIRPLLARMRLRAEAADPGPIGSAAAVALEGRPREALDALLSHLRAGGERDRSREVMVAMFEMLGDDDPLTAEFRPRLASALFS